MKTFVRGFGTIWIATSILILVSTLLNLPIFGVTSLIRVIDLGLTYTVVILASYTVISATVWLWLKVTSVGTFWPAVIGVISCMIAYWLVGRVVPGTALFSSFLAGLPLAMVNMLLIWILTALAGQIIPDRPLWPDGKPVRPDPDAS